LIIILTERFYYFKQLVWFGFNWDLVRLE
jgi:hypothetical protein